MIDALRLGADAPGEHCHASSSSPRRRASRHSSRTSTRSNTRSPRRRSIGRGSRPSGKRPATRRRRALAASCVRCDRLELEVAAADRAVTARPATIMRVAGSRGADPSSRRPYQTASPRSPTARAGVDPVSRARPQIRRFRELSRLARVARRQHRVAQRRDRLQDRFGGRRRVELRRRAHSPAQQSHRGSRGTPTSPASAAARPRPWSDGSCPRGSARARAARRWASAGQSRRSESCRSMARASAARPCSFHHSSSLVSQPTPCRKPPSIWPMSIAGFSDVPTSCRMSTRSRRVLAGQRVDRDFGHRRAVGEVEERPAGERRCDRSGSSASR